MPVLTRAEERAQTFREAAASIERFSRTKKPMELVIPREAGVLLAVSLRDKVALNDSDERRCALGDAGAMVRDHFRTHNRQMTWRWVAQVAAGLLKDQARQAEKEGRCQQ